MVGDPIADFITRITNGGAVGKDVVSVPYSKVKHAIAEKLVEAGYLKGATKRGKKVKKVLDLELLYEGEGAHRIRGAARVSKPGRRAYVSASDIYPVRFGTGTLILSTPEGILTGEEAHKKNVGGEQLFTIY